MKSFDWQSADLKKSLSLEASAGTGKTYTLERLVYRLVVEESLPLEKILVVTFTNKAARELKDRIRSLLWGQWDKSQGKEADLLRQACMDFDQASICTIHGFCQQVIAGFPLEMGLPLQMEMSQNSDPIEQELRDWLRRRQHGAEPLIQLGFKAALSKAQHMDILLAQQIQLMEQYQSLGKAQWIPGEKGFQAFRGLLEDENPLPGLLKEWFGRLDRKNLKDQLQSMGLLSKAKAERSLAIEKKFLDKYIKIWAHLETQDFSGSALLELNAAEQKELLKFYRGSKIPKNSAEMEEIFLKIQTEVQLLDLLWSDKWLDTLATLFRLHWIKDILEDRHKKRSSLKTLRFDDLVESVYQGLCGENPSQDLLRSLQNRYSVVLIDEFQDTDFRQWAIFHKIFSGQFQRYILIGDPKQSIYRFRGADLQIYFKAVHGLDTSQRFQLDTNYRSTGALIQLFNRIFAQMFPRQKKDIPVEYTQVKAPEQQRAKLLYKGREKSPLALMDIPCGQVQNSAGALNLWMISLANQISELLFSGHYTLDVQAVEPGDISVLMEKNGDCRTMQQLLSQRSIASVISGEGDIFNSPAFTMISHFFMLLNNPGDLSVLRYLLLSPLFGLTAQELQLSEEAGLLNLMVLDLRVRLREDHSLENIFLQWMDSREYMDKLFQWGIIDETRRTELSMAGWNRILQQEQGERIYTDLQHLLDLFHHEMELSSLELQDLAPLAMSPSFIHRLSDEKKQRLEREGQAVQIMTHHSSKGLQFPVVFFCGAMQSSLLQAKADWVDYQKDGQRMVSLLKTAQEKEAALQEAWEEKMKLYYVSFTRAKNRLYLPAFRGFDKLWLSYLYKSFCPGDLPGVGSCQTLLNSRKGDSQFLENSALALEKFLREPAMENPQESQGLVEIETPPSDPLKPLVQEDLSLANLPWDGGELYGRYPAMSSFTALSRQQKQQELLHLDGEQRSREEEAEAQVPRVTWEDPLPEQLTPRDLPGGAMVGNLLHQCFEDMDFQWAALDEESFMNLEEMDRLVTQISLGYYPSQWQRQWGPLLKTLLFQSLKSP
ncbi:MAG: UvrD-helicase domain-containing protein, partial [Spirochaetaceae bacterium]|nr:UvrD-helicase domain-containing protein [Spirochaetaceae bacterium]